MTYSFKNLAKLYERRRKNTNEKKMFNGAWLCRDDNRDGDGLEGFLLYYPRPNAVFGDTPIARITSDDVMTWMYTQNAANNIHVYTLLKKLLPWGLNAHNGRYFGADAGQIAVSRGPLANPTELIRLEAGAKIRVGSIATGDSLLLAGPPLVKTLKTGAARSNLHAYMKTARKLAPIMLRMEGYLPEGKWQPYNWVTVREARDEWLKFAPTGELDMAGHEISQALKAVCAFVRPGTWYDSAEERVRLVCESAASVLLAKVQKANPTEYLKTTYVGGVAPTTTTPPELRAAA